MCGYAYFHAYSLSQLVRHHKGSRMIPYMAYPVYPYFFFCFYFYFSIVLSGLRFNKSQIVQNNDGAEVHYIATTACQLKLATYLKHLHVSLIQRQP